MHRSGPGTGPDGLLDLLERGWSWRLRGCSLAGEVEPEPDLVRAAAGALGRLWAGGTRADLVRRWPACVVLALVGTVGPTDRDPWGAWWAACGRPRPHAGDTEWWAAAAREALEALGLPVFPELDPLQVLLRHAGADVRADASGAADGGRPELSLEPFGRGLLTGNEVAGPDAIGGPRFPLVFDQAGKHWAEPAPLPAEQVWLLYPVRGADVRADLPLRVVAHGRMPFGWSGWRLELVDLEEVSWLACDGRGDMIRRPVRGRTRPRLLTGEALPGLATELGAPVFGAPPSLWLPPGPARWRVSVRRPGRPALGERTVASGDEAALWQGVPRPLLGEYAVRVHGAAGQGLERTVALAEGLELDCHPAVRLLTERGLEPGEALLRTVPGMTVAPAAFAFDPLTVRRTVGLVVREHSWRVEVTPPRVRIAHGADDGGHDDVRGAAPLRLGPGELAIAGLLRIDLPGARGRPDLELIDEGRTVQRLRPYRDGRYNLRRLRGTAAEHPGAVLVLRHENRRCLVARLEPEVPVDDPWLPVPRR